MAKQTVGRTAVGAAACRMMEQYQPEATRLFDDPLAGAMISGPIRLMFRNPGLRAFTINQMDSITKGIFGSQVCRTRYIDDAVRAALAQPPAPSGAVEQLVILGAGLDTRAYRLPGVERLRVFEVDLPAVQADKKQRLIQHLGRLPENVTFLPIDFDRQALEEVFAGSAFDPARPAVFVWEAVTQYITAAAVRRTLAFVGKSAPGSRLLFTYVLKSIIQRRSDIPGANKLMDFVANESPWLFGLEPAEIPAFLRPYGLTIIADVGNAYYQEHYLQPVGRRLVVTEGERVAQAVVTGLPPAG